MFKKGEKVMCTHSDIFLGIEIGKIYTVESSYIVESSSITGRSEYLRLVENKDSFLIPLGISSLKFISLKDQRKKKLEKLNKNK